MRSGDKEVETRKQYFEIYKKILNAYFDNFDSKKKDKFNKIIDKNEGGFGGSIFFVLAGMLVFGDFKNNEAVFPEGENNEIELKVKFNISEDKKILHLKIEENKVKTKEIKNYEVDLKIPEIPQDKVIKFDDNAVRCKILQLNSIGLDFTLKNQEAVCISDNFEPKKQLEIGIALIVKDAERNWVEYGEFTLPGGKQVSKVRRYVEVSEDFKTCVLRDVYYEDEECKQVANSDKWEFDIAFRENNKNIEIRN